jgi:hypothetical protein
MLASLLTLAIIAVAGLLVLMVALAVIGIVLGLVVGVISLALHALPFVLIGVIIMKLVRAAREPRPAVSMADQRWLDS